MDTTDPDIQFFEDGTCNHCNNFVQARNRYLDESVIQVKLESLIARIQTAGRNKKYDCVVGVSGGVDSTYVCYIAKRLGLRPLAVHVDNGWNSELAVKNIENVVRALNVDLITEVLDWEEFRDLQLSMFKASTPDIELPTDHAIRSILMRTASKHNIPYILNGRNYSTEGILPWSWAYSALDFRYLSSVNKLFGGSKLKRYPKLTLKRIFYYVAVRKIRNFNILDYVDYSKDIAMAVLKEELGWRDYGGKHHESIFTRLLQGYILPHKFGIDKRIAHLSVLVVTGQIDRKEAENILRSPPYDEALVQQDIQFFLKKMNLSRREFETLMCAEPKTYNHYKNNEFLLVPGKNNKFLTLLRMLRKFRVLPAGFADNALAKK